MDANLVIVSNDDLACAADMLDAEPDCVDWFDEHNIAVLRQIL